MTEKSELISKLEVEMKNLSETHAGSQKERDDVAAQLNTANARISELEHHAHTLNDSMQVENAQLKSKIEELRTLVADKMQEDEEVLKSGLICFLCAILTNRSERRNAKSQNEC